MFASRALGLAAFLCLVGLPLAHAAPGVDLRWDACSADGGAVSRRFACTGNEGTSTLVGSFVLPADLAGVTGVEVVLDVTFASEHVPAWFAFFNNAAGCRRGSLRASGRAPAAAEHCSDWSDGASAGGLAAYQDASMRFTDGLGPNMTRVKLGYAVATPVDLKAGAEYFAFQLTFDHKRTSGEAACAGCSTPACFVLSSINVVPGTKPGTRLTQSREERTRTNAARWMGSARSEADFACPATAPR